MQWRRSRTDVAPNVSGRHEIRDSTKTLFRAQCCKAKLIGPIGFAVQVAKHIVNHFAWSYSCESGPKGRGKPLANTHSVGFDQVRFSTEPDLKDLAKTVETKTFCE